MNKNIDVFWRELINNEEYKLQIIDIGAAEMEGVTPSYQKFIDLNIANIIGFEPNENACKALNQNSKNKDSMYLPYFIGDGNEAIFYETNWAPTSSLYEPNKELLEKFHELYELTTVIKESKVKTYRLDDIAEIEHTDFLKMDIQGSELNVLQNAKKILKSSVAVQVEVEFVEMYKGQPLFADVDSFLRSQGFQFHCFDKGIAGRPFKPLIINNDPLQKLNQELWADAYYVKDWMKLELLSSRQLISYAIITYSLLGSIDLTLLIINQIDKNNDSNFSKRYMDLLNPK